VRDLVVVDASTGHTVRRVSDYTAVRLAATRGLALVGSSDPNAPDVRPAEVIDLGNARGAGGPPELHFLVDVQPITETNGNATSIRADGPRELQVSGLDPRRRRVLGTVVPSSAGSSRPNGQGYLWVGSWLLFTEYDGGGGRLALWNSESDAIERSSVVLPEGSVPIGAVSRS
jgi:hypothetical protein